MRNGEIKIDLNDSKDFLYENAEKIETVFRNAVRQAILEHKRAGNPLAVSENGKVIWIMPENNLD